MATIGNTAPDRILTSADISDNSISTTKLIDGTVATADLADSSVTTVKIADGTITWAKLEQYIKDQVSQPGQVAYFAGTTAPAGWSIADGTTLPRTGIGAALFAYIGTLYGAGDGSTTFNKPDARGVFFRGWDIGRGFDIGRGIGTYQEGTYIGDQVVQTVTLPIVNGERQYTYGTFNSAPGAAGASRTITAYQIRPSNIALLPCVKL